MCALDIAEGAAVAAMFADAASDALTGPLRVVAEVEVGTLTNGAAEDVVLVDLPLVDDADVVLDVELTAADFAVLLIAALEEVMV